MRRLPLLAAALIAGTYSHTYWDFPYRGGVYSYVRAATSAGYATFNVDRIGSGYSTHPPYTDLTLAGEATSMHDVVTALRSGSVDGHAFRHVITAGHSFGSAVGVVEAVHYRDVDGVISIGGGHAMSDAAGAILDATQEANLDPKFAGLGYDGYLTTVPGVRGRLYHDSRTSTPGMNALDEKLKDVHSSHDVPDILAYNLPATPADAISRQLTVPALVLVGGGDLTARRADTVAFRPVGDVHGVTRLLDAAAFDERTAYVRARTEERAAPIEANILLRTVVPTTHRRIEAERLRRTFPELSTDALLETPALLIGTVAEMAARLRERRERFGFSYVVVQEPSMEALAPVIEAVAGD